MEICLKSTNKEYTKLAINTFLSDVKDLKIDNDFKSTPDRIIFHDSVFMFTINPVEKVINHINKHGAFFSQRSPLLYNNSDGVYLLRSLGIIPHDFTSVQPDLSEMNTDFIADNESKESVLLYCFDGLDKILKYKTIDNYSKYYNEYFDNRYILHDSGVKKQKTYITNLFGFEITSNEYINLFAAEFKACKQQGWL